MSTFIPGGSYKQTSQKVKSSLFCEAQKRDQSWISAGFDLTDANSVSLSNMDGLLVADSGTAEQNNYVPGGSYSRTSRNEQVILSAYCQKRDQSWQWSTLDITSLSKGATISNIDGVLTVD